MSSVTGVAAAWRSSELGGEASSRSRELIRQTVLIQQTAARVETQMAADLDVVARYRSELLAARQLDTQAERMRAAGLVDRAALAGNEARIRHDLAERMLGLTSLGGYVVDEGPEAAKFEEKRRRADLQRRFEGEQARFDPDGTRDQANALDARSQRLIGWVVAFAAVGFVLTVAQVSRRPVVKWSLAVMGAVAYCLVSVGTFVLDKG